MGDVDIVGSVNDERTVLHLATDAQERQKPHSWLDDDLLFILNSKRSKLVHLLVVSFNYS